MVRKCLAASVAILVAFHAWLFAGQILSGELASPALLFQWAVAAALGWALWRLRRAGESVVRGRKAVAIWLLAALLHAPSVADRLDGPGVPALPEVVATMTASAAGATLALGLVLLLALGILGTRTTRPDAPAATGTPRPPRACTFGSRLLLAPRPPPLG